MEIVDSGRRRRFSNEAKLAIVAESYSAPRQVTATARRHRITRFQLNDWRKAAREGRLGDGRGSEGFIPALLVPEPGMPVVAPDQFFDGTKWAYGGCQRQWSPCDRGTRCRR